MTRLFIGGHRELRRPVNPVDESLMRRIEEARHRLRIEGKEVKAVRRAQRRTTVYRSPSAPQHDVS